MTYAVVAVLIALVTTPVIAFMAVKAPARLTRFMAGLTLGYNLLFFAVAGTLLATAAFFLVRLMWDGSEEWMYLSLFFVFLFLVFLELGTRHKGSWTSGLLGVSDLDRRIGAMFKETGRLWRQFF